MQKAPVFSLAEAMPKAFRSFALRFLCVFTAMTLFLVIMPSTWHDAVNALTARVLTAFMEILGFNVERNGIYMNVSGFRIVIITECSALYVKALFSAFVLSYPSTWKRKAEGLLVGLPLLTAANIARLAIVVAVGVYYKAWFESVHVFFGQIFMISMVFSLAWMWLAEPDTALKARLYFFLRVLGFALVLFPLWALVDWYYFSFYDFIAQKMAFDRPYVPKAKGEFLTSPKTLNVVMLSAVLAAMFSRPIDRRLKAFVFGISLMTLVHIINRYFELNLYTSKEQIYFYLSVFFYVMGQLGVPVAAAYMAWKEPAPKPAEQKTSQAAPSKRPKKKKKRRPSKR
jgi:exosortase/archaeosortase family protein